MAKVQQIAVGIDVAALQKDRFWDTFVGHFLVVFVTIWLHFAFQEQFAIED